jgi:hypothetical protein
MNIEYLNLLISIFVEEEIFDIKEWKNSEDKSYCFYYTKKKRIIRVSKLAIVFQQ